MRTLKALIIKKEYIDLILAGKKTWEIRRFNTKIRGPVALVSRGYIYGFAVLERTFEIDKEVLKNYSNKHRVSPEFIDTYAERNRRLYVWVFRNPLRLKKPLKISYSKGVRVWINLPLEKILEMLSSLGEKEALDLLLPGAKSYERRRGRT